MSDEYYLVVDNIEKKISICRYEFPRNEPQGHERRICSRSYGDDTDFTYKEVKSFCNRLCDIFNSEAFEKESVNFICS